jgi:hypothetical protein
MRGFTLVLCLVGSTAAAQEPAPPVPESTHAESTPPPPVPPTLEQQQYVQGLRSVGRGVAQLVDAVKRVSSSHGDSVRLKQAAQRLAGLCGTARNFMSSGRPKMKATAYADSTGIKAKRLTQQIDSLIKAAPNCQASAARQPDSTVASLTTRLKGYDTALKDFRAAVALPNR